MKMETNRNSFKINIPIFPMHGLFGELLTGYSIHRIDWQKLNFPCIEKIGIFILKLLYIITRENRACCNRH